MKKTVCSLFSVILLICVILSGCIDQIGSNEVHVGTNFVKYNLQGISDFGFNVNLVTSDKNTKVEFVSFSGENTQGLAVTLADDSYDSIKNLKYDGFYLKILGFVCRTGDEKVTINSVTLKINGKEENFSFSTPIKHTLRQDDSESLVQIRNYPLFISTNSYETTEYAFEYHADSDITVEGFTFNDFLTVNDATISINGEDQGNLKDLLPLEIKKDFDFSIKCFLKLKNASASTNYDSIYCDSLLSYTSGNNNEIKYVANNLVSQSVSNEEDAKNVIDLMIK